MEKNNKLLIKEIIQRHEVELATGDITGFITELQVYDTHDYNNGIYHMGLSLLEANSDNIFTLVAKNYDDTIPEDFFIDYQFSNQDIVIPPTVKKILPYAFFDIHGVKRVKISYGVQSIGIKAFDGRNNPTVYEIPNSVTEFGLSVFSGSADPEQVTIMCNPGSKAEEYAKIYGHNIKYID